MNSCAAFLLYCIQLSMCCAHQLQTCWLTAPIWTAANRHWFLVAAVQVWNSLPQELWNFETFGTVKKHVRTLFILPGQTSQSLMCIRLRCLTEYWHCWVDINVIYWLWITDLSCSLRLAFSRLSAVVALLFFNSPLYFWVHLQLYILYYVCRVFVILSAILHLGNINFKMVCHLQ